MAVVAAIALVGCTAEPSPGTSREPGATDTLLPSSTATSTPAPAAFDPAAGAAGNADYFDAVISALFNDNTEPDGRAIIDRLVESGFPRADMEVTPDKTAVGLDADAVQFSVRLGDQCLVGQVGTSGYSSIVAPVLGTGRCLVGVTRSIDW